MNEFPFLDLLTKLVFAAAALTTVSGALIAVLATRIIRGVCGLALSCFGLAGLYFYLHSPFLSLMEILIYVGAICVTIIFAVMLAEPDEAAERGSRAKGILWGLCALVISAGAFWGISRLGLGHTWAAAATSAKGSLKDIGHALLTTYSFAFELISVVLLVAILGALVIARYGRTMP